MINKTAHEELKKMIELKSQVVVKVSYSEVEKKIMINKLMRKEGYINSQETKR